MRFLSLLPVFPRKNGSTPKKVGCACISSMLAGAGHALLGQSKQATGRGGRGAPEGAWREPAVRDIYRPPAGCCTAPERTVSALPVAAWLGHRQRVSSSVCHAQNEKPWTRVIRAAFSQCSAMALRGLCCTRPRVLTGTPLTRVIRAALSDCCVGSLRGLSEDRHAQKWAGAVGNGR